MKGLSDGYVLADVARRFCAERSLRDPVKAYKAQRYGAREREIPWDLTFDEWWGIWQPHFHLRGRGTNQLCMARNSDSGPYSKDNVYLATHLGNALDYHDPINEAKRQSAEKAARYWGKVAWNGDRRSHISFKVHCNPRKRVAE